MTQQLALNLHYEPAFGELDFLVSASNEVAFTWLRRWPHWHDFIFLIYGSKGCGKTHLATLWAQKAKATFLNADQINEHAIEDLLTNPQNCILENADQVKDAHLLFHLINLMRNQKKYLLLTSEHDPYSWPQKLPDLLSRLKALPQAAIEQPDDALLMAIYLKLFNDQKLTVDPDILKYLIDTKERSFESARRVVFLINQKTLEQKKAISLTFIKNIFKST